MAHKLKAGIDIWLTFYDEISDERLLACMRGLLSDGERAQENRFYRPDDRKRYLVTRAAVRTVLSHYADVAPAEWQFTANAYGRPELAPQHCACAPGLCFNISHTRGLISLAFSRQRALGVDVEHVTARTVSLDIAGHFFAPDEVRALADVAPAHSQHRFFEYWTLKESYIKARGMGLSLPLDGFSFEFPDPGSLRMSIAPALNDLPDRWFFTQYRLAAHYLLAVCAERGTGPLPTITVRSVIPTAGDRLLAPSVYRTSHANMHTCGAQADAVYAGRSSSRSK